jgi:hypothetical protein
MRSSALLAAMAMAVPGAAAAKGTDQASVGLSNGIYVFFSVEGPPGGSSVYGYDADSISRGFTDPANCAYFGYEMTVRPAEGGRIMVSLGPLGARGEENVRRQLLSGRHPCTSPRAVAPVPRFPPHAVLGDGEGLSIDLLANPSTGATITDRIRVSWHPIVARGRRSDAPAPDLRLEDLPLGVFPRSRFVVDGEEQPKAGPGCRGTLVYIWLPRTRERFVFSLVPREGFDFRKVGMADQDAITFTWDGVRYEWIGEEPVVGSGVRCPVWVLKDDQLPAGAWAGKSDDGLVCGAGGPDHVLGKR